MHSRPESGSQNVAVVSRERRCHVRAQARRTGEAQRLPLLADTAARSTRRADRNPFPGDSRVGSRDQATGTVTVTKWPSPVFSRHRPGRARCPA